MVSGVYHLNPWRVLTHWGRVTHICVSDLTSIGSDNGLSPGRRQAIIRTNAGILLIRPFGTNFSEILIEILILSFKKMCLKVLSAKSRPFCLGPMQPHRERYQCYSVTSVMPQSHPTTGPVRFLSPARFLARKAEKSARRNFTSVLFSWSHQATGPVQLDTAVYLWFGWIFRRTPWVPRAGIVRESSMCFISYGTHVGPVRDPQGCHTTPLQTREGNDTARIGKNPTQASHLAVRVPYGPRTGCSRAAYDL